MACFQAFSLNERSPSELILDDPADVAAIDAESKQGTAAFTACVNSICARIAAAGAPGLNGRTFCGKMKLWGSGDAKGPVRVLVIAMLCGVPTNNGFFSDRFDARCDGTAGNLDEVALTTLNYDSMRQAVGKVKSTFA